MLAKKILAIVLILVVLLAPFLLLIDFNGFIPVVLTVWLLSAAYFVFIKTRA